MQSLKNSHIEPNLTVLLRAPLNVPINDTGVITDLSRPLSILKTINHLKKHNAKIIIIGHLGREGESLKSLSHCLQAKIPHKFIPSLFGGGVRDCVKALKSGEILMLENIRQDTREMKNDRVFSQMLASMADIFVFDAFPDAHRRHSSTYGVSKFLKSYFGIRFEEEMKQAEFAKTPPTHSICILGGAKLETKLPLVEKLEKKYQKIFVGGVLANTLCQQQNNIGASVFEKIKIPKKINESEKIILPTDFIVNRENKTITVLSNKIIPQDTIVDIGPKSCEEILVAIKENDFVFASGPLSWIEKGYTTSTEKIINTLLQTNKPALIGGGDTMSVIPKIKTQHLSVSTGGGALLHYLTHGTFPINSQ